MNGNSFSFDKIENFEDHINKSIPNYDLLLDIIGSISKYFYQENSNIYDLGCSDGRLLNKIYNKDLKINYYGYDISENMINKCKSTNKNLIFKKSDIYDIDIKNANIIYSIYTLQFIEYSKRLKIIDNIYKGLNKKGCFIFIEKEYIGNSFLHDIFTFSYYDFKNKNFTYDEIMKKQNDLRIIMKNNSSKENKKILKEYDWKVNTFFQVLNFRGYLCIK